MDVAAGVAGERMTDFEYFETAQFRLQWGTVLPCVRLAYKTLGTLNPARDNAVLIPTWFTGTHDDTAAFMVGPNRALDPAKYFIILTNLLGNGLSSSPSNTPEPFAKRRFPRVTTYDNVKLQQMLVQQRLGLDRLRLVTGWSMGASQAFEWATQFPAMVKAACPIAGSARTANYNHVFLLSLQRVLELDPAFEDGYYSRPPLDGLRAFATIYAGWGTSEPFYRNEAYRALGSPSWERHVADFWVPFFQRFDVNNLIAQIRTWQESDISANDTLKGDLVTALNSITARTIVLPVDLDRYFPPVDSEFEARHIPRGECRVIRSDWGHMAPMNPADFSAIDRVLSDLLDG